jgi:hypothetical protein
MLFSFCTMKSLTVLTIVLASISASAQTSADSWIGTWTLNVAKSTYDASPAPKSGVSRLSPADGGRTRVSQDQVTAAGVERRIAVAAAFDGKDYAVPDLPGVTYAFTRVSGSIYVLIAKEKGVVTSTTLTVVSPDGSTRTSTTTAINAEGKAVANIAVYDRQR